MQLEKGNRVCCCCVDGVDTIRIYDGASGKRLLDEFVHPQSLTNDELEELIKTKAERKGLVAIRAPYAGLNFYIAAP